MPKLVDNNCSFLVIFTLSVIFCYVNGFNISPVPNMVIKEPNVKLFMTKTRSSYFGYSMNLRQNSILIGAPRAQSSLPMQRMVNETGAIYKCPLDTGNCEPYNFDERGNVNEEFNAYTYNSEKKDYQWLGAAMDGGPLDTDRFVVCSPRLVADIPNHYLMHGLCYWTPNTTQSEPEQIHKIAPLRLKDKQQISEFDQKYYFYMFGEQGMSVHITENNEEILIGAPGVFSWKGSVIRYKSQIAGDFGGISRRDTESTVNHAIKRREAVEYVSAIPNPLLWNQPDDSYFGYAVSSGYFDNKNRILYVASAPQANQQQGEVYIFDIIDYGNEKSIKIYFTFSAGQMGEYFGYALVSEDFNGDGFYDLAISAPLHSKDGLHENGAVYIYENQGESVSGKWSSSFALKAVLTTDFNMNGRFGTTISKIGDINQDGYNDLAVAAPFEENGAVYVYLGGTNGIVQKASQRIVAPANTPPSDLSSMFGNGLSRGVDIDNNNYLDIAIGAPNSEAVYVYKTYPVAKVLAYLKPFSQELKITDTSFHLKACWSLESSYDIKDETNINIIIKVDPQYERATIDQNRNQIEFNTTAGTRENCREYDVQVAFSIAHVFNPIDIEMHYVVLDTVPNSEVFCTNCLAINPTDPTFAKNKVVFRTGCENTKCMADLKLTSSLLYQPSLPYILGSSKSLTFEYTITNDGETAYLTQLNITIGDFVSFMKIPSSCNKIDDNELLCNIKLGGTISKGDIELFTIILDATKLEGTELMVKASIFSTGDERNDADNHVEDIIQLAEFSSLEISGKSSKEMLSLEHGLKKENITHLFEIRNNGPSIIRHLDVILSIPRSYLDPWTLNRLNVIETGSFTVKGEYNNQQFDIEWMQNNEIIPNIPVELPIVVADLNMNGMGYDSSKLSHEFDLNAGSVHEEENLLNLDLGLRRRRQIEPFETFNHRLFNRYSQSIVDIEQKHSIRNRRSVSYVDDVISNLPINRTILFDCHNSETYLCIQARFSVNNFKPGNIPIYLNLNFTIDLNTIDKIVTETRDIFVLQTLVSIIKTDDEEGKTVNIIQTHPYTIVSKYLTFSTPIWVYIVSVIGGILVLILITYTLYRLGFFKRAKREEMQKLTRESQAMAAQGSDNEE